MNVVNWLPDSTNLQTSQRTSPTAFLDHAGELGALISQYNWSATSIGPIHTWPISLRNTLNNLLHSAFPMFLFWGEDLLCFYNDAFRPSLGAEGKHPAIGKKGKEIWPEIWDFIGPLIHQVITTGKPVWFKDQLVPFYRNGKIEDIYWTFSYSAAYGDSDDICGVLVTCMETTETVLTRMRIEETVAQRTEELRSAHQSLLEANEYLQNVIDLFKEPLQVLEPVWENGEIVDFMYKLTNSAYSAYASTTPENMKNKKVSEFFPGYLQTSSFLNNVEALRTGTANTWDLHYDQDGLDLYNLMSATPLGPNELVVHFTDFTKVKHLQLELEKKIGELERSNQQLEEFAHAASHDLKEPIRKIHVFTDMLKRQLSSQASEAALQMVERIERSSARMKMLVDDLLLYSYVRLQPIEKETVDLNETIKQVLEDLDMEIEQKHAIVKCEPLPVINGYRRQLQQLFQNIVSNAIKYNKPDTPPVIEIFCSAAKVDRKQYHVVGIRDNGIGFEQQYADKIFQMFIRLHAKDQYTGNGIGLSIVKKIAENHNGMVQAESVPGGGTTFKVFFPA